jgi:hypothetical protein
MLEILTDANFLIYCAKHYTNRQCTTTDEFLEDLKRIKYIKKLITRYEQNGELKERLILNHLIVLNNLFGAPHLSRILYLKMRDQFRFVKPFLILLNVMPERILNVFEEGVVDTTMISMDQGIIDVLREISNG